MRPLALLALIVAIALGAVTVGVINNDVRSRRTAQDRALRAAVTAEVALISNGEHQTQAALSLMLVDPAVRSLLDNRPLSPAARAADLENAEQALDAVKAAAQTHLSAACLDSGSGRQLACAEGARRVTFPATLGREFAAVAASASTGAASGAFVSPVTGETAVALLAPFKVGGRLLGLVHLDLGVGATLRTVVVKDTPEVDVGLASYVGGRLLLYRLAGRVSPGTLGSPVAIPLAARLGSGPVEVLIDGHRAIAARLPVTFGGSHQRTAAVATDQAPDPGFANTISPGEIAVLALAVLMLIGAFAGLRLSHRRIMRELSTDPLTMLRNRRSLMADLPRACRQASEEAPAFLWFFDLNGFKRYNDSFGHLAGDRLLGRFGQRLEEVIGGQGQAYRLGGDEFCAIISGPVADPHGLFAAAREALSESGGAFEISVAGGAVEIPSEATEADHALRLADQRMYREKAGDRSRADELVMAVLHAALAQRHPDLSEHSDDVAGDVELLARAIGLEQEAIDAIVKAGDLHDVGKLGIPDKIIGKPGPLSAGEWDFMRQHTVMGEQIIAAAGPSLEPIGPLVRSSHERWDGKGYPDGLKGEAIPLGARIIAICDSFRAMLDERPYKLRMSVEDALGELRRCAGSQFDPELVEIFCRLVDERSGAPVGRSNGTTASPVPSWSS
jgi:diguanylate cyclase (GGDEF)-like protein